MSKVLKTRGGSTFVAHVDPVQLALQKREREKQQRDKEKKDKLDKPKIIQNPKRVPLANVNDVTVSVAESASISENQGNNNNSPTVMENSPPPPPVLRIAANT